MSPLSRRRPVGWTPLLAGGLVAWAGTALLWGGLGRRGLGLGLIRRGRTVVPAVALTLEGGPDPRWTPAVLDALQEAGAQGTFFVTPEQAARWPDLTRRMVQEGHTLGLAGGGVPLQVWSGALEVVRTVAGPGVAWVDLGDRRGAGAALALAVSRRLGVRAVQPQPWQGALPAHLPVGAILRLPRGEREGLEGEGAGARLSALLLELKARGYTVQGLDTLAGVRPEGWRDLPPMALRGVDWAYDRLGRIRRIGGQAHSLFRVGWADFPLDPVTVPDPTHAAGLPIAAGERLLEFHLDSARLVELSARPMAARQIVKSSVHDLAEAVRDDPRWQSAPAVFSVSIFADVLRIYGFTVLDLPAPMARRLTWWSRTLRRAYGVDDLSRPHAPRLAVMSRSELLRRFGGR